MKALLIVDLQNDFCPGGTLAVPGGDRVIPVINSLMAEFELIIASKDWHPEDTDHFEKWPPHCIQGTEGAAFPGELKDKWIEQVFLKGTGNRDDGYSAFEATNHNLEDYLWEKGVEELYLVGLATDYCVKETAADAVKRGFQVFIYQDGVAGIDRKEIEKVVEGLEELGVEFI